MCVFRSAKTPAPPRITSFFSVHNGENAGWKARRYSWTSHPQIIVVESRRNWSTGRLAHSEPLHTPQWKRGKDAEQWSAGNSSAHPGIVVRRPLAEALTATRKQTRLASTPTDADRLVPSPEHLIIARPPYEVAAHAEART